MEKSQTYLVCPLNWGLGHASRLIPIINDLLHNNHKVIIAGDQNALLLLKQNFPKLESIQIPDLNIRFSSNRGILKLFKLVPQILYYSIYEHIKLKKLIAKYHIDVVISDNRYGLWNKQVRSVFITHQLMIKLPGPFQVFELPVHLLIKAIINQYDECWIPDFEDKEISLAGDLTHKYKLPQNAKFIGPISRFSDLEESKTDCHYDVLVILSGPEPARSELEDKLVSILLQMQHSCLIVQGIPDIDNIHVIDNITLINHLSSPQLKYQMANSKLVICRSGYSSIMDFNALNIQPLLIPTPGQTEQEYLGYYLNGKYKSIEQSRINKAYLEQLMSASF